MVQLACDTTKKWYSEERQYANPYHVKELYGDEFRELIAKHFAHYTVLYQRNVYTSLLNPEGCSERFVEFSGDISAISAHSGLSRPFYIVCLASDGPLPDAFSSLLEIHDIYKYEEDRLNREFEISCKEAELKKLGSLLPLSVYRFVRRLIGGK